jgi:putative transport protein
MEADIIAVLQRAPEIALFLALAIGYYVGRIRIAGVTLGATVSTLIAAVVIGQVGITVDPLLESVLFALFIFTIGYRGGPQFFASFKRSAAPELAFALVLAITGIATTLIVAWTFGLNKGAAGGLMAGALTQSPALGTTIDAIGRLGLSPQSAKVLADSAVVAYGICYLAGEFMLLVFARNVAPWLLGVNLKQAAYALEAEHGLADDSPRPEGQLLAYHPLDARAYRVTRPGVAGRSVADLEERLGDRTFVARIQRYGRVRAARPLMRLEPGDVLSVMGRRAVLTDKAGPLLGDEVDDPDVLGILLQSVDVVMTNPAFDGKTLREIAQMAGPATRGVSLVSIHRVQEPLPILPKTRVQIGDVVRLVGDERTVHTAANMLGYADWPSEKSDLAFVGIGVVCGVLLGLVSVTVLGVPLTLGTGGGVLLAGLVLGWLRAKHPTFGRVPPGAQWLISDIGLNAFMAAVGLSIGPAVVDVLANQGLALLLGGVIVTLTPLIVGTLFAALVLKMNPVILCGALAGAQTNAAVLHALNEAADSSLPVLGFTLPFAVNNMLLTIAAAIIVAVV